MTENHQAAVELYGQGRYEQADRLITAALAETSELWSDWGAIRLALGQQEDAEKGFRRALELDPYHTSAAMNLGVLLFSRGLLRDAACFFKQAYETADAQQRQALTHLLARCQAPQAVPLSNQIPDPKHQRAREAAASELDDTSAEISQFMSGIARLPQIDGSLPAYMQEALSLKYFDSSFYVKACLLRLRQLPEHLQLPALEALAQAAAREYRFGLVVALHHLEAGDQKAALPFLRAALDRSRIDLYAEGLLIDAEAAVAEAEGNPHPTFSGLRQYLAESFCESPWHFFYVMEGKVFLCACSGWMPVSVGDITRGSATAIWNSEAAQEIRKSILDGSFRYCSKLTCAKISGRTLPKPSKALNTVIGGALPSKVNIGLDQTCNLACPQCRPNFYHADKTKQKELESAVDESLLPILKDARTMLVDTLGEVFVSQPDRQLLKHLTPERYPNLRFELITNGQLFNRRTYEEFSLKGRINSLAISIDAATEATYRIIRRGGDFSRLLANLEFIDELRQREGESFCFHVSFVVQALNFHEMPDFIRLAKKYHASNLLFSRLQDHGVLGKKRFDEADVGNPQHPDHGEFLELLRAPEFDDPIVQFSGIEHLRHGRP